MPTASSDSRPVSLPCARARQPHAGKTGCPLIQMVGAAVLTPTIGWRVGRGDVIRPRPRASHDSGVDGRGVFGRFAGRSWEPGSYLATRAHGAVFRLARGSVRPRLALCEAIIASFSQGGRHAACMLIALTGLGPDGAISTLEIRPLGKNVFLNAKKGGSPGRRSIAYRRTAEGD